MYRTGSVGGIKGFAALIFLSVLLFPVTGTEAAWQLPTGGSITGDPAADESGTVYTLSEDRNLYAVSMAGGLLWKHYLYNRPLGYITIGPDGSLYIPLSNGETASINPSGREIWRFRTDDAVMFSPAVSELGFIYLFDKSMNLYCLDNRGIERWKTSLHDPLSAPMTEVPGWGIIIPQKGGRITAFDLTGRVRWHFLAAGDTGEVVSDGKYFYARTTESTIVCIGESGERIWSLPLECTGTTQLLIRDENIFFLGRRDGKREDFLYKYDTREKSFSFIQTDTSGGYPAVGEDVIIIAEPDGGVEIFSTDLVPLGYRPLDGKFTAAVVHSDGGIITGGGDWRLKGYRLDAFFTGGQEFFQSRGGQTRSGSTLALLSEGQGAVSSDELFLNQLLETGEENVCLSVLRDIKNGLADGRYSGCEKYVLEILERLAGEGVLNPLYQEGDVINDFPRVRIEAARILAGYGTLKSQNTLLSVFKYEWETAAAAAQMSAMGKLGSDLRGSVTRNLLEKLPKSGPYQERRIYAVAALSALKDLVQYRGGLPDPSALELIMTIYRGNYGREAREAALDFMGR